MKQTICLDFDGVIHSYTSGWQGDHIIPDPPVPLAKDAIEALRKDYKVVIYSTRGRTKRGLIAIKRWLRDNDIKVDGVAEQKPPALVYVDDRGIQFRGDWVQTIKDIQNFDHYLRAEI